MPWRDCCGAATILGGGGYRRTVTTPTNIYFATISGCRLCFDVAQTTAASVALRNADAGSFAPDEQARWVPDPKLKKLRSTITLVFTEYSLLSVLLLV